MELESIEKAALLGATGFTFETIHGSMDQWGQPGWAALGCRMSLRALVIGHVVINGLTHWKIDRRAPLHALAKVMDKEGYIQHATVVRKPDADPESRGGDHGGTTHSDQQ